MNLLHLATYSTSGIEETVYKSQSPNSTMAQESSPCLWEAMEEGSQVPGQPGLQEIPCLGKKRGKKETERAS